METKGIYRDTTASNAAALEKMKKEIAAEGAEGKIKFSIELPEDIKIGAGVLYFGNAIKKNNPEDIVFYSLATGILKYTNHGPDQWTKKISYKYNSPNNPSIGLTVELPPKKYFPATISGLSTKADVEKEKIWLIKSRKRELANFFDGEREKIEKIKNIVENNGKGKFFYNYLSDQELKEDYLTEVRGLKTSLENLLFTINDKLEDAGKK